jgi:hypothetical protein
MQRTTVRRRLGVCLSEATMLRRPTQAVVVALIMCGSAAACAEPRGTNAAPLSCPATFVGTAPWVPDQPDGIDGGTRMAPSQAPVRAFICGYHLVGDVARVDESSLTGKRQLTGGLTELATDLTWLPPKLAGSLYACAGIGLGQRTNFLIGLTYPAGTEWVSSTDDAAECTTTSNGRFTSSLNIGAQVAASFQAATWTPIPPPRITGTDHDPCAARRAGRLGQDQQLVPGQPTSIRLCAATVGRTDTSYGSATLSHGFQPVLDALNALSTTPTQSSCQGDGSQATFYELLADYDQGPNVAVRIDPHCVPAIDNRTVQAANAKTVVPLLDDLLR